MQFKTIPALMAPLALVVCLLAMPSLSTAQVRSPGPDVSEMRAQCIQEMAKDAEIRVACMQQHSDEYHALDAKQVTKNNKHVVMAYGALWGIVVVFVVGMWMRQRKLSAEILRLEAEIKKAAVE